MKATNTLSPQAGAKTVPFSAAITGDALQNLIRKSVATQDAAARFTGALVSAVAASPQLQKCKPATIVAAALKGEGQGLSIGREYHLVPFGDSCAYVISYKGLISLCLAGNDVADMDCIEVREGELVGRDKRTKRPQFDFSRYETDEEAAKHPVIGYYAYVEMASGLFRFEYMSVSDILDHATRYSKAFDREKYERMVAGDCTPQEIEKLMQSSPWYGSTEIMMKKTVLRKLLNSGYIRLSNSAVVRDAIAQDDKTESGAMIDLDLGGQPAAPAEPEIVAVQDVVDEAAAPVSTPQEKPKQEKKQEAPVEQAPADAVSNFFGDEVQ